MRQPARQRAAGFATVGEQSLAREHGEHLPQRGAGSAGAASLRRHGCRHQQPGFVSRLPAGAVAPAMLLDELAERALQQRGVDPVAAPLGGPDVVDEHVAHQQLAVGPRIR